MKHLHKILFLIVIMLGNSCAQQSPMITTFILVRHAEKADDGTEDPDLKPEGQVRANNLASLISNTPIDAIYATKYQRTKNTVRPLAENRNIPVRMYEPFKEGVIEQMINDHRGGTIVISGHSNNIPWTANLLIGKESYKDFEELEYGNLFIVSVVTKGKIAKVTRLRY